MRKSVLAGGAMMLLIIGIGFGITQGTDAGRPFVADALALLVLSLATVRQSE